MRHLKSGRKLNRNSAHRRAMLSNMVTSLLLHEQVRTTDAKAKELRRWTDRMVTLGKRGTLHARRQALAFVRDRRVVAKLFDEIAARFRERPGGYTRVTKLGIRRGDAAPLSMIELTERGDRAKGEAEKKRERKRRVAQKKAEVKANQPPPPPGAA
jgi:large subunit ribosomal protein L17